MLNISELMALSEASTGFAGGTAVDYYPELSLTEAAAALPIAIMESQCELINMNNVYNQALVETTISGIRLGGIDESAYDALNEASIDGLKARVDSFFEKIKKFIRSIIEKLKFQINRIAMNGKKLWSTYKDTERVKKTENFKDFSYEGYANMLKKEDPINFTKSTGYDTAKGGEELINAVLSTSSSGKITVDNLIDSSGMDNLKASSSDIANGNMPNGDVEAGNNVKKVLEEMESSEVKAAMAKQLVEGISDGDDWKDAIREKLYGDKETLEYGKDFTIDQIGEICSNPADLSNLANEYAKFEKGVSTWQKMVKDALKKFETGKTKASGDENRKAYNTAISLFNAYLSRLNDAYAVISEVKNIRTSYYKDKNDQAKNILVKLLALGGKREKKPEDESIEFDDEFLAFT